MSETQVILTFRFMRICLRWMTHILLESCVNNRSLALEEDCKQLFADLEKEAKP